MEDPHNFRITPDVGDDEESDLADLSSEAKPRILLMGLKRCASIITLVHFIPITMVLVKVISY